MGIDRGATAKSPDARTNIIEFIIAEDKCNFSSNSRIDRDGAGVGWLVPWRYSECASCDIQIHDLTNPSIFFVVSLPFFLRSVILSSFLLYFTGGSWQTFCPNKNPSCARLIFEKLKMLKGRCLRVVSFLFFSFSLLFRCVR